MRRVLSNSAHNAKGKPSAPADGPAPAMKAVVSNMRELRDVVRARRDQLNLPHLALDDLAGIQSGYTSKLLCEPPIKNFGPMSLGAILGALGMGIAVVILTEDVEEAALVKTRWVKRIHPSRPRRCVVKPDGASQTGDVDCNVPQFTFAGDAPDDAPRCSDFIEPGTTRDAAGES